MAYIQQKTNKKGETVYKIKVSCGYSIDGKQITHTKTYKPNPKMTPKQIEKELNRQVVLFEQDIKNSNIAKRTAKFEEIAKEWLAFEKKRGEIKISSLQVYKGIQARIYKSIGHIPIDKINKAIIQNFIFDIADGKDGGKPLTTKTQKNYLIFISNVCNYAIDYVNAIKENPCKRIEFRKTETKERKTYSIEEEITLLQRFKDRNVPIHYIVYYMLLIYLGLRKGEALGLEWGDFDLEKGTVFVQRQVQYQNSSTGVYISTPKTKNSIRNLVVPKEILDLLPELKAEQEQTKINVGDNWHDSDLLFTTWNGEPMRPNRPYAWLKKFCEREKLPFKSLHSFRHSLVTNLIHNNVDVATVSNIVGHSNANITYSVYTHEVKQSTVYGCNKMSDLLKNNEP